MGEWKKIKLKEVLTEINERNKGEKVTKVLSVTKSQGFVSQEEYFEGTVHSENISNYKIVRKNQFAYNPSRVNVGSIDILKKYDEGALSPMYVIFEVDETKLLPEYFKYYFQTHNFFENVKNSTQGSVRNSLSFKALASFEYMLPPIEEQEKIINILHKLDDIINKMQLKNDYILKEKVTIFNSLIVQGNRRKIDKLLKENKDAIKIGPFGSALKKEIYKENGYKIYTQENVINENFKLGSYFLSLEDFNRLKAYKLYENDLVISMMGTIGSCTIVPKESEVGIMNSHLLRLQIDEEKALTKYIYYLIKYSKNIKNQIRKLSVGGIMEGLSSKILKQIQFPIVNMEKQKKIVEIMEIFDRYENFSKMQLEQYIELRKGLMQKLLTGKVRVKI